MSLDTAQPLAWSPRLNCFPHHLNVPGGRAGFRETVGASQRKSSPTTRARARLLPGDKATPYKLTQGMGHGFARRGLPTVGSKTDLRPVREDIGRPRDEVGYASSKQTERNPLATVCNAAGRNRNGYCQ